jgi:hypothetical protein
MQMHPDITQGVARQRQADMIAAAERHGIAVRAQGNHRGVPRRFADRLRLPWLAAKAPAAQVQPPAVAVVIRLAGDDDAAALASLATLDSRRPLAGPVVVAVVAGELWAARSLSDGRSIGDPFRQTAGLGALLELRARQLTDAISAPSSHAGASNAAPVAAAS